MYIRTHVIVSTLIHACPGFSLSSEDESEMVDNGVVAAVGDRTHTPRIVYTHLQAQTNLQTQIANTIIYTLAKTQHIVRYTQKNAHIEAGIS